MNWNKTPPVPKVGTPAGGMTREQMEEMLNLAESMTKPHMERIMCINDDTQKRDEIVRLTMALGFGIAALHVTFFPATDPRDFGRHLADYISQTVIKLRQIEKEDNDGHQPAATSAWDTH